MKFLHVESLVDGKFSKGTKGVIILIFLIVPFISSVVSMLHVVKFLGLGNTSPVSITLAITYEIANLTILMAVVLMKKLRAGFVWACFIVLLIIQIVGNVYYSYDYILQQIAANPQYLATFISFIQEMVEFESTKTIVFVLSCFLGLPIPMVSLLLVKSVVDYLELGAEGEVTPIKEPIEKSLIKEEPEPILPGLKYPSLKYADDYTDSFKDKTIVDKTDSFESGLPVEVPREKALESLDKLKEQYKEELHFDEQGQPAAENSSEVINTKEKPESTHIGLTIRPADDNNSEHRD